MKKSLPLLVHFAFLSQYIPERKWTKNIRNLNQIRINESQNLFPTPRQASHDIDIAQSVPQWWNEILGLKHFSKCDWTRLKSACDNEWMFFLNTSLVFGVHGPPKS